jgi:cation transport ATPase
VIVGNRKLLTDEHVDLGGLAARRDQLAATGRTAVFVAVDGRAAAVIAMADAPRDTAAALTMSGSSLIVAVNALLLKRLRLPATTAPGSASAPLPRREPARG